MSALDKLKARAWKRESLSNLEAVILASLKFEVEFEPAQAAAELAALEAIAKAARAYVDACVKAAETKEWDDMQATEKEYNELANALKVVTE